MHPFSEYTPRIVYLLPAQANLKLFSQIHGLQPMKTGHDDIMAIHVEPFASSLPRNSHFLYLDSHPSHFLLKAEVFDDLNGVITRLYGKQYQRLL
jgi:hypothetical protein